MFTKSTRSLGVIESLGGSSDNNYNCTEEQMKKKFDEAAKALQVDHNDLIDQLANRTGAGNIGCNNALGATIEAALLTLLAAGSGSIPPDNTISSSKLMDGSVTSDKLASSIISMITSIKAKFVNLSSLTPTIIDNGTSTYVTEDKYYTYDLGFTPTAAILFKIAETSYDNNPGGTYYRMKHFDVVMFGEDYEREYSSYDNNSYYDYGGVALTSSPCIGIKTGTEVFRIVANGIRTHRYTYSREYSDGGETDKQVAPAIYCLAIG